MFVSFLTTLFLFGLIPVFIFDRHLPSQSADVVMTFRTVKRQCWNEKVSVKCVLGLFSFSKLMHIGPRIDGSLVRLAAIYFCV